MRHFFILIKGEGECRIGLCLTVTNDTRIIDAPRFYTFYTNRESRENANGFHFFTSSK